MQEIDKLYESVIDAIKFNKLRNLGYYFTLMNDVEERFEKNYQKKKKEGVFYTHKEISDFIFSQALISLLNNEFEELKLKHIEDIFIVNSKFKNQIANVLLSTTVCDPACGSGVFLLSAASSLYRLIKKLHHKKTPKDLKLKIICNLYGFEINNSAIKLSKLKLLNWFCDRNSTVVKEILPILNSNLKLHNSIVDLNKSNFDIIIGNPPYGNILNRKQKELLKKEEIFYNDIYCAFILKALNWTGKIIAFLVPKSFLLRQGYIQFRNDLLSKSNLLKIYDLGSKLFKKATNEVQVLIYEKRASIFKDLRVYGYPNEEILVYKYQKIDALRICFNEKCRLNDNIRKIFVYTFQKKCPYCGSETVLLNRIRIKASKEVLELLNKVENVGDLNYLNMRDFPMMIRGEEANGLKEIKNLIKKNLDGSYIFINAKEDFTYFYFKKSHSFNIESINSEMLKGNHYEFYTRPKLLIKHNNIYPQTLFTKEKVCFTSSIYSLLHDNNDELKYLCSILNSILIQFYCFYAINNQKDTTVNLNQYMVRHLPIIHCEQERKKEIIQRVEKVSELLSENNGKFTSKIKQLIREINEFIFELYSISDKEKSIIISLIKDQVDFFKFIY